MALVGRRDGRNFGYGRQLSYAGPQGQDREQVKRIVEVLCENQQPRAAAIAQLARATGMRLREAILADLLRLKREAKQF